MRRGLPSGWQVQGRYGAPRLEPCPVSGAENPSVFQVSNNASGGSRKGRATPFTAPRPSFPGYEKWGALWCDLHPWTWTVRVGSCQEAPSLEFLRGRRWLFLYIPIPQVLRSSRYWGRCGRRVRFRLSDAFATHPLPMTTTWPFFAFGRDPYSPSYFRASATAEMMPMEVIVAPVTTSTSVLWASMMRWGICSRHLSTRPRVS